MSVSLSVQTLAARRYGQITKYFATLSIETVAYRKAGQIINILRLVQRRISGGPEGWPDVKFFSHTSPVLRPGLVLLSVMVMAAAVNLVYNPFRELRRLLTTFSGVPWSWLLIIFLYIYR